MQSPGTGAAPCAHKACIRVWSQPGVTARCSGLSNQGMGLCLTQRVALWGRRQGCGRRGCAGPGLLHAHVCGGHAARPDQRGAVRHRAEQQRAQARQRGRAAGRESVAIAPLLAFSGAGPEERAVRPRKASQAGRVARISPHLRVRAAHVPESQGQLQWVLDNMHRQWDGPRTTDGRASQARERALGTGTLPAEPRTP